ncbi:type I polyketide synthase [Streptomyces aurantiacus]|uniref:Phthiocerol synthesis polyketide synthase type I PpsA n=1 Tax=Streptomyces aurantiacus TaxID=47760 RepID=A0A7G1PA03_9ACTN|nr:type I polyketide synthase [Streptomyces aurantiacus]BCL32513.1 phthiocerol synthesis polyketide synthase type I PpsA [Streptomyces aurantiacus]
MTAPEPIAVVGLACRFAGGIDSPEKFWSLLREGRDTIGEVPDDRWEWYGSLDRENAAAVGGVTRYGAFLDDIKGFDADFFEVTPREAALMDPQQRIVLELAWEALEHAGIPPRDLAGSDAGVFMGVGSDDYGRRMLEDLPRIEAWTGIGGAYCGVANRVSYVLDLHGPSVAVDTACSSSLVSVHLAVQSLRDRECPVALAGGVLVMASPGLSLVLDAAGATAPDGRCKSFDASGDGYGRGEGGGVVVLKRLSDARRDGDRVLALIRGSAVHQDGRTSGIMAPNGEAQAHLMRRTYERAGLDPATVGYVEAHGTGTPAGDPLEARAMASVFGVDRPREQPCLIGSVKPNIGHLEAGAGIAGVIKAVLALRHAEIPPSLNFHEPNPAVPWATSGLRVVTEPTPWPETAGGPRRAGVSGYGYGGTIAHVVLEQAPDIGPPDRTLHDEVPEGRQPELALYPLSGAGEAAVREYAGKLADRLDAPASVAEVGHTLARRRSHLPHRATVVAAGQEQLAARLREFADTGDAPGLSTGSVQTSAGGGLVWVFSGHGSQWTGMARELLAREPVFAETVDRLEPVFLAELGISPRAALLDDAAHPVDVVQPLIFAVQTSLSALWQERGLRPDAVLGHSVGEIAAAVTAGVLTLEQGARLVCRRSLLLRKVAGKGAMAMVGLTAEEAELRLAGRRDVTVAITASPGSTVISGDIPAVADVSGRWRADGVAVRAVDSDVAFHSPHMDPLLEDLAAAAADLTPSRARIPVYGTALDDPRDTAARDGRYWAANLGGRVRFRQAVQAAVEDGYRLFLEVSPHPVVEHSVNETLDHLGVEDAFTTHSLRRRRPERETLLANLGQLYCHGAAVDWSRSWPDAAVADLPGVAWQRRPHWLQEPPPRSAAADRHDVTGHTLLGGRTTLYGTTPARSWRTHLDHDSRPYPGDHPVRGVEIVPAAVLLNTFLTAAARGGTPPDLADVALRVPVAVPLTRPRELQVVSQDGTIRLTSRPVGDADDDNGLITHTTATVEPRGALREAAPVATHEELPAGYVVDRLAELGVAAMGFPWRIDELRRADGALTAVVRADPASDEAPATWAPVLDAALSTASVVFPGPPVLRMPAHIRRVTLEGPSPALARITVRITGENVVDVDISDTDGAPVGRLAELRYGLLEDDTGAVASPRRLVHRMEWRPLGPTDPGSHQTVVLVGDDRDLVKRLSRRLVGEGVPHRIASAPEELRASELTSGHTVVVVPAPGLSGEPVGRSSVRASWLLARTAQRLAAAASAQPPRLWCVTQGVRESADEASLSHAPLWGLGRVIAGEHPELWGGLVDIGSSPRDVAGLVDLLGTAHGEDILAVREGRPEVARLALLEGEPVRPPVACRPDSTYLITGGLGALGLEVAHWLAGRGARRIVLSGRRALPSRDQWDEVTDPRVLAQVESVKSLERMGTTVVTVALDVSDADAAEKLLAPAALGLPPVRGVVHAAGVLDDRPLRSLDEASLRTVLRPKTEGAWVLHGLFPPGSLDFLVLFSSCGQLLGLPGQSSYAAGNAFLDALAAHRRAVGDTGTVSFGWTSWRGLGMSTSSEVIDAELAAHGTADVTAPEAFASWELAERYDLPYAAVLRTLPPEPGQRRPPLLSEVPTDAPDDASDEETEAPWAGLAGDELRAFLTSEVSRQVAAETHLGASEVDPHRALTEMGLDSVMTVRIRRGLERQFRMPLPATLFWDRPTVHAVADLLAQRVGIPDPTPADEGSTP